MEQSLELDSKAAQFSHVDHSGEEEYEHMMQRALPGWQGYQVRLSENTDFGALTEHLDRHNILKDHPSKYSLKEEIQLSKAPPEELLPIPGKTLLPPLSVPGITTSILWNNHTDTIA